MLQGEENLMIHLAVSTH